MTDDDHHKGPYPLATLPLGPVTQFPLDYMHSVCLGVMRQLLRLWLRSPVPNRLDAATTQAISFHLVSLVAHTPQEFARKPRSLVYLDRWKATELRQFLLYSGPLVLLKKLEDTKYNNFLLFSFAIRILLSPNLCNKKELIDYSKQLLLQFVKFVERTV